MIDTVVQGLLLGGLYSLFALGQSLLFGVMRLTNTAQGDFIVLAAFGAIALAAQTGASPLVVTLCLLPLAFGAAWLLQRGVLSATLGRDPLPSLVVTFGLAIIIQNGLQAGFSADPRALPTQGLASSSVLVAGMPLGVLPLMIFGIALAVTGALQWLFHHTALGRALRAVSDDRDTAALMGLSPHRLYGIAAGVAGMLVLLAGVLQAMRSTVAPSDGPSLLLFGFEAVVIGGMGSFWGTFVGALLLGLVQQVGFRVDPGWGVWAGHVACLAVLLCRPQGLFPKTAA